MAAQSERFGFKATVKYRFKPVILFRQGDLKFMPNDGLDCHAARFADVYERSVCRDIMGLVRKCSSASARKPRARGWGHAITDLSDGPKRAGDRENWRCSDLYRGQV